MRRRIFTICLLSVLALGVNANPVSAGNFHHAIGLAYTSGAQDVFDFYDEVPWLDVDRFSPVGLFYRLAIEYDSGVRTDIGIGPLAFAIGDVDYHDVPLTATIGYNLNPKGSVNPYLRGGLSYHFVDGDYVDDPNALGLFGAIGLEFGKGKPWFFVEVAYDTAEITMKYDSYSYGYGSYAKSEDIKVTDLMISAGVMF